MNIFLSMTETCFWLFACAPSFLLYMWHERKSICKYFPYWLALAQSRSKRGCILCIWPGTDHSKSHAVRFIAAALYTHAKNRWFYCQPELHNAAALIQTSLAKPLAKQTKLRRNFSTSKRQQNSFFAFPQPHLPSSSAAGKSLALICLLTLSGTK